MGKSWTAGIRNVERAEISTWFLVPTQHKNMSNITNEAKSKQDRQCTYNVRMFVGVYLYIMDKGVINMQNL
jgi:hypothetical protein